VSLTLGAAHVASVPTVFSIANPVGLSVHLAGIPNYVPRDIGTPAEYHRLARLNLGNSLGYKPHLQLVTTPQLIYPLEPEYTLLSVNMTSGVTVTIDEIASSTTLIPKAAPYDRSATVWSQAGIQFPTEPFGATTLWTYTVPAGRMLWIAAAHLSIVRTVVATTNASAHMHIQRGGVDVFNIYDYSNVALSRADKSLDPDGMVLLAGETIACTYQSGSTAGQHLFMGNATGYSFAA
jgi:hypothetical protein